MEITCLIHSRFRFVQLAMQKNCCLVVCSDSLAAMPKSWSCLLMKLIISRARKSCHRHFSGAHLPLAASATLCPEIPPRTLVYLSDVNDLLTQCSQQYRNPRNLASFREPLMAMKKSTEEALLQSRRAEDDRQRKGGGDDDEDDMVRPPPVPTTQANGWTRLLRGDQRRALKRAIQAKGAYWKIMRLTQIVQILVG